MIEDFFGREMLAEEVRDQIVIAFAMHAGFDIGRVDAVAFEVALPGERVSGHGIDNDAVEVE